MAREDHQLKFRVPDGLKQRIEETARVNKRSLNAEIVATLEEKYPPQDDAVQKFIELIEYELSTKADGDERQRFLKKLMSLMTGGMERQKG